MNLFKKITSNTLFSSTSINFISNNIDLIHKKNCYIIHYIQHAPSCVNNFFSNIEPCTSKVSSTRVFYTSCSKVCSLPW